MGFIKCYDAVKSIIDEATRQFSPIFKEDRIKKEMFKEQCNAIDWIAEQFGGVSYEININDVTMRIMISLVCEEFELDKSCSDFLKMIDNTLQIAFKEVDENYIQIDFVFDGVWEKAI